MYLMDMQTQLALLHKRRQAVADKHSESECIRFSLNLTPLHMATSTIRMDSNSLFGKGRWNDSNIYQSRISNNQARWIKVGNTVFVNGRFRSESALTAGTAIATGFPVPTGNTGTPLAGCTSNNSAFTGFCINANGSLCTTSALTTATYYNVCGVYFTD